MLFATRTILPNDKTMYTVCRKNAPNDLGTVAFKQSITKRIYFSAASYLVFAIFFAEKIPLPTQMPLQMPAG